MTVPVWLHRIGPDGGPPAAETFAPLARRGFALGRLDPADPAPLGVLVLARHTPAACQLVAEWSQGGLGRLLVVVGDRAILADGLAWRLLRAGAADVLVWDDLPDPLALVAARLDRWCAIEEALASPSVRRHLIGRSRAWVAALRQVVEAALFTRAPVLLLGETGTGKEEIARAIHALDPRADKGDLVVLDCTTVVPDLAGSEFFGHERGAFTGAIAPRDGAFALADGGTLFLDEVGELPPALQAQLLRVVQERTYKRVGGNTWRRTDFRLVCATNRDLLEEQAAGRFRADLYYRLAGWVCRLPPLRERPEDILPLARHFMHRLRPEEPPPDLNPQVRDYLLARPYPGNVRDLKHLAARIMDRHVGPAPITIGDIPADERPPDDRPAAPCPADGFDRAVRHALDRGAGLKDIRRLAEDTAIRLATEGEHGNLQRAARLLGVTDRALQLRRAARRPDEDADGLSPG